MKSFSALPRLRMGCVTNHAVRYHQGRPKFTKSLAFRKKRILKKVVFSENDAENPKNTNVLWMIFPMNGHKRRLANSLNIHQAVSAAPVPEKRPPLSAASARPPQKLSLSRHGTTGSPRKPQVGMLSIGFLKIPRKIPVTLGAFCNFDFCKFWQWRILIFTRSMNICKCLTQKKTVI